MSRLTRTAALSVPNVPKTPHRTFRIPADEYDPAKAKAEADERYGNLTAFVRAKMREYMKEDNDDDA